MGGGALAAALAANWTMARIGPHLPGINLPLARAGWNLVIPVLGAWAVKLMAPNVARGMIIGGIANAAGQFVIPTSLPAVAPVPAPAAAPSVLQSVSTLLGAL